MTEPEALSAEGMAAAVEVAEVNEDELPSLDARAELTAVTYRRNWGLRQGQHLLSLPWPGVTTSHHVYVSIHEANFIGAARYTVHNVAPRNGAVDIWVNVEWGSPIPLYADYLVVV